MKMTAITIARFTFYEAMHNRFILIFLAALLISFGLAEFLSEMAITESRETIVSIVSFVMRLFAIVAISLFVITGVSREFNDRILWHIFSLPKKRYVYYLGKLMAYAVLSLIVVSAISLLLMFYTPAMDVIFWAFSMFLELLIIIAFSLLCLITFRQITLSFLSVMGFYLLARNMATFQLISNSPILETNTFSQHFIDSLLQGIAYVLPALNEFARSDWLLYGAFQTSDLYSNILQTIIYVSLLSFAAIFDLYRLEL